MRIAITGGTGFVGRHLAERLASAGHEVVLVSRGVDGREGAVAIARRPGITVRRASVADRAAPEQAFAGCAAVAHCAGINREIGAQTYQAVHVRGTANVVAAAEAAGVGHLGLLSFLRARPACGSGYHESKWEAEQIVRAAGIPWTVLKPGLTYGRGDHYLDHLSHAVATVPVYVGIGARRIRPLWVDDLVDVLSAAAVKRELDDRTVPVLGPTEVGFDDAVRQIARVLDRRVLVTRLPMAFHRLLAVASEAVMTVPLVARSQVRMLAEEIVEPVLAPDRLPDHLLPTTPFSDRTIRAGLPPPGRFGLKDLRLVNDPAIRVR